MTGSRPRAYPNSDQLKDGLFPRSVGKPGPLLTHRRLVGVSVQNVWTYDAIVAA